MMWYRFAQSVEDDNSTPDRQTLDMTGGVRSRKTPSRPAPIPQIESKPVVKPIETEIESVDKPLQTEDASELVQQIDQEEQDSDELSTFTDYTPPSSAEEDQVAQAQDMYRAEDLAAIIDGSGVQYPMHESCRCRIQFRPDDSAGDLLVPRWEASPGACNDCLNAQQMFNQYVEQTGVRVQPPNSANV